jgi:hypothetical protein
VLAAVVIVSDETRERCPNVVKKAVGQRGDHGKKLA